MSVPTPPPDADVGGWEATAADAVVGALAEWDARTASCRLREVHLDADDDLRFGFDVTVVDTDGSRHDEVVWAARLGGKPPPNSHPVPTERGWVGVWRHPYDPVLPGLVSAATPGALAGLVRGLADATEITVVSLDPLRRAVVRVGPAEAAVYVRVLPPDRIASVVDTHERCADAGLPVPVVLRTDPAAGLVVTAAQPGRPLADHLLDGGRAPDAGALWNLVRSLGDVDLGRRSPQGALDDELDRWANRVATIDSSSAGRVTELAGQLAAVATRPLPATIHGDLHHGQLLVDASGSVSGIVDLDESGTGDLLDDLGRLIANATMGTLVGAWPPHLDPAPTWLDGFTAFVDGGQLRHRSALALLGRAAGPWMARQPDALATLRHALDAAEHLLGT